MHLQTLCAWSYLEQREREIHWCKTEHSLSFDGGIVLIGHVFSIGSVETHSKHYKKMKVTKVKFHGPGGQDDGEEFTRSHANAGRVPQLQIFSLTWLHLLAWQGQIYSTFSGRNRSRF